MFKIIIFLIFFAILQGAYASTLLMSNDFENGWGVIGHGPTGGDANGTSLTTENSHSGSYSGKVDYSGGKNLNHIWYDGLQSKFNDELYVSFWFYYHPNWQQDHNHKIMRVTSSLNNFNSNFETLAEGSFFENGSFKQQPSSTCGNIDNSWYTAPSGTYDKGKWHHFEWHGKLNSNGSSNGTDQVWIDGKQIVNRVNNWTWLASGCNPQSSTYKWNTIFFPSNYADVPPSGSTPVYYVDDIEIWSGMPSSTSPRAGPRPPTITQ